MCQISAAELEEATASSRTTPSPGLQEGMASTNQARTTLNRHPKTILTPEGQLNHFLNSLMMLSLADINADVSKAPAITCCG